MQVISALSKLKELQGLTRLAEDSKETETAPEENKSTDFEVFLRGILQPDSANNVSEEDLFAGLIGERLKKVKGEETATKYNELLAQYKDKTRTATGYVPVEDAAKGALKELRDTGVLTAEETDQIYSEAFSGAQLDSNTSALFDGLGGEGDPTIAVQKMDAALVSARLMLDKFDNGTGSAEKRSVDEASNAKPTSASSTLAGFVGSVESDDGDDEFGDSGASNAESSEVLPLSKPVGSVVDGPNGFLFKPISENEGTLAVLLPESLAHKVEKLLIKDSSGNVLEEGRSTGYGDTGERQKFAFSKQGGAYPDNLVVEATLTNGSIKQYVIPDPARRYD